MAPRRGGSGGSSGGSGGSCSTPWPCTSELNFIYGNRPASLWTKDNLYGQLVPAAIWALALFALCWVKRKKVPGGVLLVWSMVFFIISFVFLCVRYGIVTSGANVLIGYRYEHSIVVLMERIAWPLLLMAVHESAEPGLVSRIVYGVGVGVYAVLNIVYAVFDFLVSNDGLLDFQENEVWRLGDRDFAVTMDSSMIRELKTGATGLGLDPAYVRSRLFDLLAEDDYLSHRDIQTKIGVVADVFAVALVLLLGGLVVLTLWRRRESFFKRNSLLLIAVGSLLLSTLFQLVVSVHYVLHNWKVISSVKAWSDFIASYPRRPSVLTPIVPPAGFLEGYRVTGNGFPVVKAVLIPFGIVVACVACTWLNKGRHKEVVVVHHEEQKNEQVYNQGYQQQTFVPAYHQNPNQGYAPVQNPGYAQPNQVNNGGWHQGGYR